MLTVRSKKCRVGCPGEPDSLTHYDKCPLSHNIIIALRRNAAVIPFIRTSNSIPFTFTGNGQQQVVKEGQSGWVLQTSEGYRANGKSYFTMMSLHTNNHFAEKRGIDKNLLITVRTVMLQEQVYVVAGDFNGAAWRRQPGGDHRPISIIEEAFANTSLPIPPGPTPLWRPGDVPGEWADIRGIMKPPGSEKE